MPGGHSRWVPSLAFPVSWAPPGRAHAFPVWVWVCPGCREAWLPEGLPSCLLLEVGGAGDRAPTSGGVRPLTAAGQEARGWRRSWSRDSGSAATSVWDSVLPPPSVQIHTLT